MSSTAARRLDGRGLGKEAFTPLRRECPKTFLAGERETGPVPLLQAHQHDVIYFGVVNLVHQSKIIGTIDVWRCRSCSELFCEDKRFGATDLAPEVGFPKIEAGSKWAALICTRDNGSNWTLTAVKPGATLTHSCTPETKLELNVTSDYSLQTGPAAGIGKHRVILIDQFINSAVDVETGQKHLGTTDAYQALGKPFSFTPPLSAAVVESSKLGFFNVAAVLFFATGAWTLLAAGSVLPGYGQGEILIRSLLTLLGAASVLGGYLIFRKTQLGPLVGLAVAVLGLVGYTALKASITTLLVSDYALDGLLALDILFGWIARTRINALREARWHPLDMPAYG